MLFRELEEVGLDVVWVVLDLQSSRLDLGVCEEVEQQSTRVVGDTNALGQTLLLDVLKRPPGVLEPCVAVDNLAVRVVGEPARWVPCLGRDILQRHREVNDIQVEVVNTPVLELLLGDGLDLLVVVECLPKLGHDEEVLALYETLLDGAGDTLTGFDFVAVIWENRQRLLRLISRHLVPMNGANIPSSNKDVKATGTSDSLPLHH